MKGTISFYFATGEEPRPQFIGINSLNDKGFVTSYDEIYDIEIGDQIIFLNENFLHGKFTVDINLFTFLYYLTNYWQSKDIEVEFNPAKDHKSWSEMLARLK